MDAKNIQALLTEADGFYSAHSDVMNLVCGLAAALKASEERATAAELDAASLRAAWKIADQTSLTAECQAHAKTSFDLLGVAKERDALAAANLAANKRIVELEQERDAAKRQISALENQLVNAAALRIEDEAHCERLIAERDAARAELARLTTERDEMAAEIVFLRKRLSDLTTPRPIAEAPRDGKRSLLHWEHQDTWEVGYGGREGFYDKCGRLLHSSENPPTHFLPLPVEGGQRAEKVQP